MVGGVAYDLQRPDAGITVFKSFYRPESSQAGILNHIFSVIPITGEPTRQRISFTEMREDNFCEEGLAFISLNQPGKSVSRTPFPRTSTTSGIEL